MTQLGIEPAVCFVCEHESRVPDAITRRLAWFREGR